MQGPADQAWAFGSAGASSRPLPCPRRLSELSESRAGRFFSNNNEHKDPSHWLGATVTC